MEQIADNFPMNAGINVAFPSRKVTFSYSEKSTSKKSLKLIYMSIFQLWFIANILMMAVLFISAFTVFILAGNVFAPSLETASVDFSELLKLGAVIGYMLLLPLIPSAYLTWKYEKFSKIFPKLNYFVASLFEVRKSVIVESLDKPVFELPLFQNVYLGYEATEDFSKFLKNIEVKEFGFKCIRTDIFKKEKEVNLTSRWRAIFSFSQVPKNGKLVINFI